MYNKYKKSIFRLASMYMVHYAYIMYKIILLLTSIIHILIFIQLQ